MEVSVALATFNGDRFVAEQVASILAQTRPVSEIVVSDDGSTDDTVAVIERTVADWRAGGRRPRLALRVLRNAEPLGVSGNFEQAMAACTGDLIALCDQDDRWTPDKVATMAAEFERRDELDLLHSDAGMVSATGAPLGRTLFETIGVTPAERAGVHDGRAYDVLMRRNIVTGATAMLRRRLVEAAAPFPGEWVHDEWLAVVAAATGTVDLVDEPLIDYRQHGGNQIGATVLTGTGRFSRLRAPRTARNARLLARAAVLAGRIGGLRPQPSAERIAAAAAKLAHEEVRSALPAARIARPVPVLREWRTGRYSTCGLGPQDVLRDLVQPV